MGLEKGFLSEKLKEEGHLKALEQHKHLTSEYSEPTSRLLWLFRIWLRVQLSWGRPPEQGPQARLPGAKHNRQHREGDKRAGLLGATCRRE